jgi:hypothetical protein
MLGWLFNNTVVTCEMTAEERFRVVLQRLDDIERKIDYVVRALGGGGGDEGEAQEQEAGGEREEEGSDSDADSVESSKTS